MDALQLLEDALQATSAAGSQFLNDDPPAAAAAAVGVVSVKEEPQVQAPHLGDLYVYGVLRGLEGLAVHDDVMAHYDEIPKWYHHMRHIVEPSK
jgi:hypothetical protein